MFIKSLRIVRENNSEVIYIHCFNKNTKQTESIPIANARLYRDVKNSRDALSDDSPLKDRLTAYAKNYLQKKATEHVKVNTRVSTDWSKIGPYDKLFKSVSPTGFFKGSGNSTGLRILPYSLVQKACLIKGEYTRDDYMAEIKYLIETLRKMCPSVKINAYGYVSSGLDDNSVPSSYSEGLIQALCRKSNGIHATALIPARVLKPFIPSPRAVSPSYEYNNNVIRFGKLGDKSIKRFVRDSHGELGAIPLEHNPHIMLGHEMIHALRFRYGLDKPFTNRINDHMTVSIYANDLSGMKDVIGKLKELVNRYYGMENSIADISFDLTNHKISEFEFDPEKFIFEFTSSKVMKSRTRPLIRYQKEALIDSLTNFEQGLDVLIKKSSIEPNTLDFVRCNLDLLLGLLTGEHNDTNAATAIERSSSAEFQSQLKKLYSQYSNDRKILKQEVCTQLKNSMLIADKVETIKLASAEPASSDMEFFDNFSYIPDDDVTRYITIITPVVVDIVPSVKIPVEEAETTGCQVNEGDLDPKCPYTESLLRRESRPRETGIEAVAYTVTTALSS